MPLGFSPFQSVTFLHIPSNHHKEEALQLFLQSAMELHNHRLSKAGNSDSQRQPMLSLTLAGKGVPGISGRLGIDLVSREARVQMVYDQVANDVHNHGYSSAVFRPTESGSPADAASTASAALAGVKCIKPSISTSTSTGSNPAKSSLGPLAPLSAASATASATATSNPSEARSSQSGVIHLSCWDAVDETLPVQYKIGAAVLKDQLLREGLLRDDEGLDDVYPEVGG